MNYTKKITYTILAWLLALPLYSQNTLSGVVKNESGKALSNVIVKAYNQHKKLRRYTQTNRQGEFRLATTDHDSISYITLSRLSYETKTLLRKDFGRLKNIILRDDAINIKEVVVKSVPIRQNGDTLTYAVNAFKKGNDRSIEDVLKRMPGISIDNTGGIYYQGERISKFYIENMDMLSGNYTLATKNIRPDDVAAVNVYENHQPVRALKNFAFSDKAALNLKLKSDRKLKPIGYLQQGVGYDDQTLWKSDVFAMQINKKSQQLLSLKANDTGTTYNTTQAFGFDRISDFSSFTWDGISLSAQDIPSVSLSRYVDNKSGEGSINSLFKLKDKRTLTLNLRYAGDEIHYQNQKYSNIFVDDNLYQDFSEKMRGAVYANSLNGKIKMENNTEKLYFLDNLTFNSKFYHKRYELEDNFDGTQKQKSANYQLTNQFSAIYHVGKKVYQLQSNIKFSNTPVNRLEAVPTDKSWQMYQSLNETAFQTDEHTSFGWQLCRLIQMGIKVNFESFYNKIRLARLRSEENTANTVQGYMLNTSVEPYFQMTWSQLTWEVRVPLSLLNVHFKSVGEDKDLRLDNTYANINTTLTWNMAKGLKFRLKGGTRCNFGDISNFVTSPIFYTYKDATTKGTGSLTNRNALFASSHLDFHNTMEGIFASVMAMITRSRVNSMSQTSVSGGNIYSKVTEQKNTMLDKSITVNASKSFRNTDTSISLMANLGNYRTNILSKNNVLSLENNRILATARLEQALWNDKLNLSLDYSYYKTKSKMPGTETTMQEHQGTFGLSFFLLQDLELFGDVSMNWLKDVDRNEHESYANAGIRYKKKSIEVELLAKNLTNQNVYVVNKQTRESYYKYIYQLRPIGCTLSVKYNF